MRFIYMPTFASTKQQLHSHIAIQCVPKGQVSSKSHTPNPLMLKLQDLLGHYNLSHGPDTTRFSVGIRTALPWQGETMILRTCGTCQNNTGLSVCQIWLDPKNQLCTTKTLIIPGVFWQFLKAPWPRPESCHIWHWVGWWQCPKSSSCNHVMNPQTCKHGVAWHAYHAKKVLWSVWNGEATGKLNELQLFWALYIVSASVLHSYHNLQHISSPDAFITLASVGTCRGALQGPMPSLRSNISSNGVRYLAAEQFATANLYASCHSCHLSPLLKRSAPLGASGKHAHLLVQSEATLADDLTKKLQNTPQEIITTSHTGNKFWIFTLQFHFINFHLAQTLVQDDKCPTASLGYLRKSQKAAAFSPQTTHVMPIPKGTFRPTSEMSNVFDQQGCVVRKLPLLGPDGRWLQWNGCFIGEKLRSPGEGFKVPSQFKGVEVPILIANTPNWCHLSTHSVSQQWFECFEAFNLFRDILNNNI